MFNQITKKEVDDILKNIEWVRVKTELDDMDDDGGTRLMASLYSPIQSFGATDYKDHRSDNIDELKKLIEPYIYDLSQRGHYYSKDGSVPTRFMANGYYGGYTGHFIYKDNSNGFGH